MAPEVREAEGVMLMSASVFELLKTTVLVVVTAAEQLELEERNRLLPGTGWFEPLVLSALELVMTMVVAALSLTPVAPLAGVGVVVKLAEA